MKPDAELLALIPAELHGPKLRCTYHQNKETWYVYRIDAIVYDPQTKHSKDQRTQLGSIKHGVWRYSPSWLKQREIEELKRQQAELEAAFKKEPAPAASAPAASAAGSSPTQDNKSAPRPLALPGLQLEHLFSMMYFAMLNGANGALSIADYAQVHHHELALIMPDLPASLDLPQTAELLMDLLYLFKPRAFLGLMMFSAELTLQNSAQALPAWKSEINSAASMHELACFSSDLCAARAPKSDTLRFVFDESCAKALKLQELKNDSALSKLMYLTWCFNNLLQQAPDVSTSQADKRPLKLEIELKGIQALKETQLGCYMENRSGIASARMKMFELMKEKAASAQTSVSEQKLQQLCSSPLNTLDTLTQFFPEELPGLRFFRTAIAPALSPRT